MSKIRDIFKSKKEKIERISISKKKLMGTHLSSPLFHNELPILDKMKQGNMNLLYQILTMKPTIRFDRLEIEWERNLRSMRAQARRPLILPGLVKIINPRPVVPRERLIEILRRPKVFIEISNECGMKIGRFLIDLYSDIAPKTVGKFAILCANYQEYKEPSYVGTEISRLFSNLVVEFAISPRVPKIKAENFDMPANKTGSVAMLVERDKVGSKFIITLQPLELINQRHVVIGRVVKGLKTLLLLRNAQSNCFVPRHRFYISNSGMIPHVSLEKTVDWNTKGHMQEMSKLLHAMDLRESLVAKEKIKTPKK